MVKKIYILPLFLSLICAAQESIPFGNLFFVDISLQDAEFEILHGHEPKKRSGYSIQEIRSLIKEEKICGVFFKNTPNSRAKGSSSTVKELCSLFKRLSKKPLLFGIDAEWGLGMRLHDKKNYPKNRVLGALEEFDLIEDIYYQIALEAKEIGINFITSPVADVAPDNSYIKERSFSDDPIKTALCCRAALEGLKKAGIISCAKHFPGHGRTATDSHKELPVIVQRPENLQKHELIPFKELIFNDIPAIMVGHLLVPSLDSINPATISTKMLNMLRHGMCFEGVIISDALDMKAIAQLYSPVECNLKCLSAGIDILLFPRMINQTIEEIKGIIATDRVFHRRILQKTERIQKLLNFVEQHC